MDGYMVVKGEIELIYPESKIKLTLRDDGEQRVYRHPVFRWMGTRETTTQRWIYRN